MTSNPQTSTFEYKKLTGNEQFFDKNGQPIPDLTMLDFWQYQFSNIWDIQPDIADYLDDQCKHIDEAIQLKQEQLDKLTEYKASVIYEYVTGKKQVL